ncbi:MAG: hypothetical protein JSS10_00140 [Verrucomicrobia bacterium]|nr:hypothetical protein [Verrucomicrobiota bacterium]
MTIATLKNGYEPVFDVLVCSAVAGATCWIAQRNIPQEQKESNNIFVPRHVALIVGIESIFRSVLLKSLTATTENLTEINPFHYLFISPCLGLTLTLPLSIKIAKAFSLKVPPYLLMMGYIGFSRHINLMARGVIYFCIPAIFATAKITLARQ